MARAEAAGPSVAKACVFSGLRLPAARRSFRPRQTARPAGLPEAARGRAVSAPPDPGPHRHLPGHRRARPLRRALAAEAASARRGARHDVDGRHRPRRHPRRVSARTATAGPRPRCSTRSPTRCRRRHQRRPAHLRHRSPTASSSPPRRARSSEEDIAAHQHHRRDAAAHHLRRARRRAGDRARRRRRRRSPRSTASTAARLRSPSSSRPRYVYRRLARRRLAQRHHLHRHQRHPARHPLRLFRPVDARQRGRPHLRARRRRASRRR